MSTLVGGGDFWPHVFNNINSNIGVGLLAMPFCFHECGIVLTIVILAIMSVTVYFSSILILKSTLHYRCDSLEVAAYKSHGVLGKRLAEISVVGLLFGMLISLNVAISDLGSEIAATIQSQRIDSSIRAFILLLVIIVVSPFCFIRRFGFLSSASTVAVFLYTFFLLNLVVAYAIPRLLSDYFSISHFRLWRLKGLVHCVPIIASSLCCQIQVSTIYSSLKNPSLQSMKKVLLYSVAFIFLAYSTAGLFGYMAFYNGPGSNVAGDMLAMYPEDYRAVLVRLCFLYTVAASLPLLLFPIRAALHCLLFEEPQPEEGPLCADSLAQDIPPNRFRWLTLGTLALSMTASQTTDKVEVILAYTGGFAGGASCYLLPAAVAFRALGLHNGVVDNKRGVSMLLIFGLMLLLGSFILISPFLTFLGVDS